MINCLGEFVLHHRPFGLNKTVTCLSTASNILIYGHRPKVGSVVKIRFKFAKKSQFERIWVEYPFFPLPGVIFIFWRYQAHVRYNQVGDRFNCQRDNSKRLAVFYPVHLRHQSINTFQFHLLSMIRIFSQVS